VSKENIEADPEDQQKAPERRFHKKARLIINTLHLVQQKPSSGNSELKVASNENHKEEEASSGGVGVGGNKFKTKVKRIVNIIKFSTFKVGGNNKVNPEEEAQTETKDDEADEEIEVLISSHLEHFMHKLEEEEEILMESNEEGLLATNLIEELSGCDLGFLLREGDMLLNNHEYFQITGLSKLNKQSGDISDDDEDDFITPRQRFKVRRKSTASLLTRPPSGSNIRPDSASSITSLASNYEDINDENDDEEEIFKLTVRANSRRYSIVSLLDSGCGKKKEESVKIPIVVVTAPQETTANGNSTAGWENGYDNFKFRLKKTMKEREAYLQKQLELQKRRGSLDSVGAEREILKMRLKKRRHEKRKMKKNSVIPKS